MLGQKAMFHRGHAAMLEIRRQELFLSCCPGMSLQASRSEQRHRRAERCRGGQAEQCSAAAGLALMLLHKCSFHIAPERGWFAAVTPHGVPAVSSHVSWILLPSATRYSFGNICRGWFISLQTTIIQSHYHDRSYYSEAWRSQPRSELKTFTARGSVNALRRCCFSISFTAVLTVNAASHLCASMETWILHLDLAHSSGSGLFQCHLQLLINFK